MNLKSSAWKKSKSNHLLLEVLMANYYAQTRSNYFPVKDYDAFVEWCKKFDLEVLSDDETPQQVGFLLDGSLPCSYYDETIGDFIEVDFLQELADHLQDDFVAIIQEVGHEK